MKTLFRWSLPVLLLGGALVAGEATRPKDTVRFPRLADHGGIFHLPDAPAQPRDGSKVCVDITSASPPEKVHAGLEKVARYVNIYAGAGQVPAKAIFTVILHGEAITACLSDEAYARRFGGAPNPSLPLIKALDDAGVELFVCGQSLLSGGMETSEVVAPVKVAVSALTVGVNCQEEGYALVPIR